MFNCYLRPIATRPEAGSSSLKENDYIVFCFDFNAPEPKAQVHYCDHALSVVRSSLTFHIFDFFSETAEQNSTKLDRQQDRNVLYHVCVFRVDRKNFNQLLIGWDIFDFSSETAERNSTKRDRKQNPLPSLVFFGPIGKSRWPSWSLIG